MSFDLSRGQRAFLTGCWLASFAFTSVLVLWDLVTGRNR